MTVNLALAYDECKDVITQVVGKFAVTHGGEPDELLSEAHYHFTRAVLRYDPGKGPLRQWIRFYVATELLEGADKIAYRKNILSRTYPDLTEHPDYRRPGIEGLLAQLGDDSRLVALLALLPSPYLMGAAMKDYHGGGKAWSIRYALIEVLSQMGWTAARITESFKEIREALQ